MRLKHFFWIFLISACTETKKPVDLPSVKAMVETRAISANIEDDAADDPAIWYNQKMPEQSLIIGSNKTKGVDLYNLSGELLSTYEVGRINNVDVRTFSNADSTSSHILGGSNRSTNSLDFWSISDSTLELTSLGTIQSQLPDVYGFCLYDNRNEKRLYALVNSKTGKVEQWHIQIVNDKVEGSLVRILQLPGQVEGMVADDQLNKLYIGVEEGGIYKFEAEENASTNGVLIQESTSSNPEIEYDIEGLTIYRSEKGQGYLIASIQGNFSYAVFDRVNNNNYLGSFTISDGLVDGVEETDGIDVSHHSFGSEYPRGLFVCQDGYNYDNNEKASQNFKIIDWREIEDVITTFK